MPNKHIVISGTGRCGTSFLVELLTHLGLDTGYSPATLAQEWNPVARAGLEHDLRRLHCPYVVKSPWFCDYAAEVFQRKDIRIEHLFIPMRDLTAVAESRRQVQAQQLGRLSPWKRLRYRLKRRAMDGGLVHTQSQREGAQEAVLQTQFYQLVLASNTAEVPMTFLRYPRLVTDPAYLFDKLRPILGQLDYQVFHRTFSQVAKPELVHQLSPADR